MLNSNSNHALLKYRQVGASDAAYMEPLKLIHKLYEAAMDRVNRAKNCIETQRIEEKCEHIDRAMNIIEALQLHLDKEKGEQIALQLDDLYDYMNRRLLYANMNNDTEALHEVSSLLGELLSAWCKIDGKKAGMESGA